MSEKIVKRTKLFKDSLYEKNKNILNIVYYLGNKIMLKEQLIILSEIILVNNSKIKDKIEELIKEGFLKEKQVLNSNKYAVYLTRYPISKIEGKTSNEVNGLIPSKEKILNSLFETQYLIKIIIPCIKRQAVTINSIKSIMKKVANTVLLNKNHAFIAYKELLYCHKLKNMHFNNNFFEDMLLAEYEYLARFKNENQRLNSIDHKLLQEVENIKKHRIHLKTSVHLKDEEYFFNLSNMLNRNFDIRTFTFDDRIGYLNLRIDYFDINNPNINKIYSNIGYIYNMFKRYFDGIKTTYGYFLNLELEVTIYTSQISRMNSLQDEAKSRVKEFSTGEYKPYTKGENTLINAKIPNSSLDKITVKYKLFDFESIYNIKIK